VFEPCEGVNVIYGDNGQGKTNLLEAMALFSGMKSFRGVRNSQMLHYGAKQAQLELGFHACRREQTAKMTITAEAREAVLNNVPQRASSALIGELCFVVFSPDRISLITGGASERRKFVDAAIAQSYPRFANILSDFNKTIAQRNALIKGAGSLYTLRQGVAVWDAVIASAGAKIALKRAEYVRKLSDIAERVYEGISSGREKMSVRYQCSFFPMDAEKDMPSEREVTAGYLERLEESIESDFSVRFTTRGPQRDDLVINLDGRDIRIYGSQGQKRSAVLALKLAEAELLSRLIEQQPIALLDDVMSELDSARQSYLLNRLDGWQVFITCCDPSPLHLIDKGAIFEMQSGVLRTK